jgi:hypothetical protein
LVEEFIFRLPTGEEVGSAKNLEEFLHLIEDVPKRCLEFHHIGGHFAPWLRELGHEELAIELAKIEARGDELRRKLVDRIGEYIKSIKSKKAIDA